jgi:hypothetical protein
MGVTPVHRCRLSLPRQGWPPPSRNALASWLQGLVERGEGFRHFLIGREIAGIRFHQSSFDALEVLTLDRIGRLVRPRHRPFHRPLIF